MIKHVYVRRDARFEDEPADTNYLQLVYEDPKSLNKTFVRLRQVDKKFQEYDSYDYYFIGTFDEEGLHLNEKPELVFKGANRCSKKSTQE